MHLVPPLVGFGVLTTKLVEALDALTISPFLVIDDKLVEVFNGNEVCEIVKDRVLSSLVARAPPEDVHISNLLLECKCTWQVVLVEILFNL